MKRLLAVFIALAVAAALLWKCGASLASVAPPHEPTPGATESPAGADQSRGTATPTPSPHDEEQLATPTCTPLDEEDAMTPQPTHGTPEATLPYEARRLVQIAKEDLARRLELSVSEISLISVEAVDWPDTSLGCPQPGMMYAQVITPGYLIVLEAKGQSYEYHTDTDQLSVLCGENGFPAYPTIPVRPGDIDDGEPWLPVD